MNTPADYDFLFWLGWSAEQVADALNVKVDTANRFRRALKHGRGLNRKELELEEFDEQVRILKLNGATRRQMRRELGATERKVDRALCRLREKGSLPPAKYTGLPIPEKTIRQVEALLDDGTSFADIHRTLGVSERWLQRKYPGRGWSPQQVAQYRHMKNALDRLDNPTLPKL